MKDITTKIIASQIKLNIIVHPTQTAEANNLASSLKSLEKKKN